MCYNNMQIESIGFKVAMRATCSQAHAITTACWMPEDLLKASLMSHQPYSSFQVALSLNDSFNNSYLVIFNQMA